MVTIEILLFSTFLLVLSTFTFFYSSAPPTNAPKLPLYIGRGYDVLQGNPLSTQGIDTGFRQKVFDFVYTKNYTTYDGKYIIPDGLAHNKKTYCSLSTYNCEYLGTHAYQIFMSKKVQIDGDKGILYKASFTQSPDYKRIYNQTINRSLILTHAVADCQIYQFQLDIFKPGPINADFWQLIKLSYTTNNWENFIRMFGTHYVYELVMGGRAIQEIRYPTKSVSVLQAINVNLTIASKANFAEFFGDTSFDFHQYETQIKYSQIYAEGFYETFIGSIPPKTGKAEDWRASVTNNPMPISYKINPLSDLFLFSPDKSIDMNAAKVQFLEALDQYCAQNNCHQPELDKLKPRPATVQTMKTAPGGGTGGTPFQWSRVHPTLNVRKVHIRSGSEIDNIQVELGDGISAAVISPQYGGKGGSDQNTWIVPNGEYINQVEYRCGSRVDSLTFITNRGSRSPKYGGNGGSYKLVTLPEDYKIIGLFGNDGARLDQLGFIIGKTVANNGSASKSKHLILTDERDLS